MLTTAARRAGDLPVSQGAFDRILSAIWWKGGNHPRLGLAISGGVDSMALASLCSRTTVLGRNRPLFTAFVVDHRIRKGSDVEAEKVARMLRQMRIDTQILKLDWSDITDRPDRLVNLESVARRLRFQALGKACRDLDINSLLLAHHGDDQAETVMTRLITGYTGSGFRGIKSESRIPECHTIYGVSESGSPHHMLPTTLGSAATPLQIESGGVYVYRPLLDFQKTQLIATCQQNAVRWFEDPTNTDKGLTLRNTIRHLWANTCMPRALGSAAMLSVAQRAEERGERREEAAEGLFDSCIIELDVRSGSINLAFPTDFKAQLFASNEALDPAIEATYRVALLLRRILMLTSPKERISLQELDNLAESVLESLARDDDGKDESLRPVNVAGMSITRQTLVCPSETRPQDTKQIPARLPQSMSPLGQRQSNPAARPEQTESIYRIERERVKASHESVHTLTLLPTARQRASSTDLTWTEWQLFDGRFWIRLRYRPFNLSPNHSIIVRFLNKQDIESLRKSQSKRDIDILDARLKHAAPGKGRFTLPALVERSEAHGDGSMMQVKEEVCALPSIGWGKDGWRYWKNRDVTEGTDNRDAGVSFSWECRYKMIAFGNGKNHSIKGPHSIVRGR